MSSTPTHRLKSDTVCYQILLFLARNGMDPVTQVETEFLTRPGPSHTIEGEEEEDNYDVEEEDDDDDDDDEDDDNQQLAGSSNIINQYEKKETDYKSHILYIVDKHFPSINLQDIDLNDRSEYDKVFRTLVREKMKGKPWQLLCKLHFRAKDKTQISITSTELFKDQRLVNDWVRLLPYCINHLFVVYNHKDVPKISKYPHLHWAKHLANLMVCQQFKDHPEAIEFIKQTRSIFSAKKYSTHRISFLRKEKPTIDRAAVHKIVLGIQRRTAANPSERRITVSVVLSTFLDDIAAPVIAVNPNLNILGGLAISKVRNRKEFSAEYLKKIDAAMRVMGWAADLVGMEGRAYNKVEWNEKVRNKLSIFRRDSLNAQRLVARTTSTRHMFSNALSKDGKSYELTAAPRSYFFGEKADKRRLGGVKIKGVSAAQMQQFTHFLNEVYNRNKNAVQAIKEFGLHVDYCAGKDIIMSDLSGCEHENSDKLHDCMNCNLTNVPCAELNPLRGPLCSACLDNKISDGSLADVFIEGTYYNPAPGSRSSIVDRVLYQAKKKAYNFKAAVNKLLQTNALLPLGNAKDNELEPVVRSWATKDGDVDDAVLGLGSLGRIADSNNPLLRPSVVRLNRTYLHDEKTYLFHPAAIAPTISGLSIAISFGSLEGGIIWAKRLALWQSRRSDVLAKFPTPDQKLVQDKMTEFDNQMNEITKISNQIPHTRREIAYTSPAELGAIENSLRLRLIKIKLPFFSKDFSL